MCFHENICNQSSHRDFQSVNLKCELKERQNFSKGRNLDTFQKNTVTVCCVPPFFNPHYKSYWLVLSILGNVSISKTALPQIKASIKLEKNQVFSCHAHAAYCYNSKFKIIILILCLIHAAFVLRSSQHYSWVPPRMESVHWSAGIWTLVIFTPCFNCAAILERLRSFRFAKSSGSFPVSFLKPKLSCYFSIC